MSYRNAATKYKNIYNKPRLKKMHIAHIMHNRNYYETKSQKSTWVNFSFRYNFLLTIMVWLLFENLNTISKKIHRTTSRKASRTQIHPTDSQPEILVKKSSETLAEEQSISEEESDIKSDTESTGA